MNSSTLEKQGPRALSVVTTDDALSVDLTDGRTITVPLAWYPRLAHATPAERSHWRLIGDGEGVHWPDLDEDVRIMNLVLGEPSGESQTSLDRWLRQRGQPPGASSGEA
jgi:hypothetical protein